MNMRTRYFKGCMGLVLSSLIIVSFCNVANGRTIHKLYATHPFDSDGGKSSVSVYDFGAQRMISTLHTVRGASLARVTPDGKVVWFFSSAEKSAGVFSVATDEFEDTAYLDGPVSDAVFDPDSALCYVACGSRTGEGLDVVKFIDTKRRVAAYTIGVGKNPVALAVNSDGNRLYVANKDDNSITIVDPRKYTIVKTIYAGVSPHDVQISSDNKYLFVANSGVDNGVKGGSCVTILDAETGQVLNVVETGYGPTSIGLTPDARRMVVAHLNSSNRENLWFYDIAYGPSGISVNFVTKLAIGTGIEFGCVDPTGKYFVVADHDAGGIYSVDMLDPQVVPTLPEMPKDRAYTTAFGQIDYDSQIALRDSIIARDPSSPEAINAYFEKARLHNSAGERNEVVATLNELIAKYPGSAAEVKALFSLGSLCYNGLLFANAADYYNRGLIAYAELLSNSNPSEKPVSPEVLVQAADRLGELSQKLDTDYSSNLYKVYSSIPVKHPEFPELFFEFGVALEKRGDGKSARKCYSEVEDRLIELMDDHLYQKMKMKLALVRRNNDAILHADKLKDVPVLDGDLNDWKNSNVLSLDRRDDVIVNQLRWFDPADVSGQFQVGYDQFNLYVAAKIADDKIQRPEKGLCDYVNFYFDVRDGSGNYLTREKGIGEGVISIRVKPPADLGGKFNVSSTPGVEPLIGGKSTQGGYAFELKIPLAYLKGLVPAKGNSIGMGIELFDIDSSGENDPPKIMGWLMPTESTYGTRFSGMFGILEF